MITQQDDFISIIKNTTTQLKETVTLYFDVLRGQNEIAKKLAVGFTKHPSLIAIEAICDTILNLLDEINRSCEYSGNLIISPFTYGVIPDFDPIISKIKFPPIKNIEYLKEAISDLENPPTDGDDDSDDKNIFIGIFSFRWEDFSAAQLALKTTATLFGLEELQALVAKLNHNELGPVEPYTPPKFEIKDLDGYCLLPGLYETVAKVQNLVNGIKGSSSAVEDIFDAYDEYFDVKEAELIAILDQLEKLTLLLEVGIESDFFWWSQVTVAGGGVEAIKELLNDPTRHPAEWAEHDISVSFLIVNGVPMLV